MPTAARRSTRKTASGIRLPRVDARTRTSRRYVELVQTFEAEIGREPSEADRVLIKQAATIALLAEQHENSAVAGTVVDPDVIIRLTSECRRILTGLKEKSDKNKPAGSPLAAHLAANYGATSE